MGLGVSLNTATGGLQAMEAALDTISRNVANASTDGYVTETPNTYSDVVNGRNIGVRVGHNSLALSPALQAALYTQNGKVSNLQALYNSLSNISALQGTTGANSDGNSDVMGSLSNYLGNLKTSLVKVTNAPTDGSTQYDVISNAQTLVRNVHVLTSAYQSQRQNAQDAIVSSIPGINTDLTTIGSISKKIMVLQASGGDTSDLENQRLGLMNDLSNQLGVSFTEKPNGDMVVTTEDGTLLPTRPDQIGKENDNRFLPSSDWPLSTKKATIAPNMYYSNDGKNGGIPGIMLDGEDITQHLTGGPIGANITLRDQTYPTMQAQMDSFASTLINRFDSAGLPLFTPPARAAVDSATNTVKLDSNDNVIGTDGKPLIVDNVLDSSGNPLPPSPNGGGYYVKKIGSQFVAVVNPGDTTGIGNISFDTSSSANPPGKIKGASIVRNITDLSSLLSVNSDYVKSPGLLTTGADGKVGDLTLINSVLSVTFSSGIANVSGGLAAPTSGLGPDGSFSTGYPGTESLDQLSTDMTSTQARVVNNAKSRLSTETGIQTNLTTQVNSVSGVNVNNQMSMIVTLQNSYAANAKVVSAVRDMFSALLNAV
ncbi:flagellar basal body rod C-terminal domain-containing protein [Acetobacteraceae bacterium ESL0709]|nr:flagellar basal body rod C-terminal domain-containing protein [Acetobacteraceae bacterium ESL0697]MDF7679049.1 flagellar basal body rod C-terminal domain-containing protein [Acetobacteraceae bacterium ESL0709]